MDRVSILMSIYNESEMHIRESLDSLLSQTWENFELIIVIDNPQRNDIEKILTSYNDDRIKIIYNKANIGLAESMNIALRSATGLFIARMDADDVAKEDRIEKELSILKTGQYDIVCSNYIYIDEQSKVLNRKCTTYINKQLIKFLPYRNTLHHPTVMMTRNSILKVNGYRNFPCSQDYDLWLRLMENRSKFYIINEPLLKYRVRDNSITESNSFKQIATIRYIKRLYRERRSKGFDSYSIMNYNRYIETLKLNDEKYLAKCQYFKKIKDKITIIKSTNKVHACFLMAYLFFCSDFYRRLYIDNVFELARRSLV